MRRLTMIAIGFVLIFAVGVATVGATPMTVTSSLPFVWIRATPSSYAAAVYTLYPNYAATVETTGWVEQGALVSALSGGTPQQPVWGQNQFVVPYHGGWQQPYAAQGYHATSPRLVPYYGQITYGSPVWQGNPTWQGGPTYPPVNRRGDWAEG